MFFIDTSEVSMKNTNIFNYYKLSYLYGRIHTLSVNNVSHRAALHIDEKHY